MNSIWTADQLGLSHSLLSQEAKSWSLLLLWSPNREIEKKYQLTDGTLDKDRSAELGFEMVAKTIKSWNFVVNKQPMEVTAEILGQFPMIDFIILQEAVTGKKLTHKNSDGSLAIGAGDDTDAKKK